MLLLVNIIYLHDRRLEHYWFVLVLKETLLLRCHLCLIIVAHFACLLLLLRFDVIKF